MNSAKINDWIQVFGIFALVASLIFVGLQMRQDHEIAKVMIYQSRASTTAEILATMASIPDSVAAQIKSSIGEPITAQEMMLGQFRLRAIFTLADNSLFQYQEGFLPEDHWLSVRNSVRGLISSSQFVRDHVASNLDGYRVGYRDELIEIMKDIDEEIAD